MSAVDSGHHFLQIADEIHHEQIPLSTYFNSLKSPRRANMLMAVEQHSYQLHCETLQAHGIDYLKNFPQLDDYIVEAADGHFIQHACHTEKGSNGKVYAAGFIYALNLRNGLLSPLCTVTSGTCRHHEIPILRDQLEKNNKKKPQGQKNLYVYDKAATDYAWWDQQKSHDNYMISVLKENSSATLVETIPFDQEDEVNTGIESYDTYENDKGIQFSVVTYRDPENGKLYQFITTLPLSIKPGIIAILYYKRWTIEKAFNNSKSDFKETKAWSSNDNSLKNQMRLTTMSYNFMRVFEEISKQQEPKLIHPSEKKYREILEKRQQAAEKKGCFLNPLLFQPRIARISSYTIRAAQNAITTGRLLVSFMSQLAVRLVPG
jgi:IS4 transposase